MNFWRRPILPSKSKAIFMMSDHKKVSDNDPSKKWQKKTGKVWMTMPVWEFLSNSI